MATFNTFSVLKPLMKETYPSKKPRRVKLTKPIKIAKPEGFK